MERLTPILLCLMLSGCALTKPATVVAAYPKPPVIERPQLESDNITESMALEDLIQAYRISIIRLKDYAKSLEKQLDAYR